VASERFTMSAFTVVVNLELKMAVPINSNALSMGIPGIKMAA